MKPDDLWTLTALDLEQEAEGFDLEAKLASGRDGRGELPRSFFETYSAMANTDGGVILLGVREHPDGRLEAAGVDDVAKVQKALWDGLNNKQKTSENVLSSRAVEVVHVDGVRVIRIHVPRATRHQRPVHVGPNPLEGTYRRNHEGDYRCSSEEVRRMLAERVEDARDERVLVGYTLADLDSKTLARYRQNFKALKPDHVWNNEPDQEFLRLVGGWRRDRRTGEEGLTAAGLLMFGKMPEILENFPYYMLDYQERPEAKTELRWSDRLTLDGTWSGNVFDFYQLVIQRLVRDLKTPFRLRGDTRVDDTPVHEALRETLVNTLIHADYTGRVSLLIVKRPDLFGFRNPGMMRVAVDVAERGGVSDCRNRRMQAMFRHVNLGEQAGSGLPKVYAAWRSQQWRAPELYDTPTPSEQTVFKLRMASLLPDATVAELERRLGDTFRSASEVQKLALVTVAVERKVTHARLKSMTDAHPREVTLALASLVQKGILDTGGHHKSTYYYLPGEPPPEEPTLDVEGSEQAGGHAVDEGMQHSQSAMQHSQPAMQHSGPGMHRKDDPSLHRKDPDPGPDMHRKDPDMHRNGDLQRLAEPFRASRRVPREAAEAALLSLCDGRFLTLAELANLTGRTAETLRNHYVGRLVAAGRLRQRHPDSPRHPNQAYTKA